MIHFKDNKNKSALSTRWAQMSKQEQIIERKKMEIQAKLESQKQAAALAAQAKRSKTSTKDEQGNSNIFSNDGSFMSQFKALLEKQKQESVANEKQSEEDVKKDIKEESSESAGQNKERYDGEHSSNSEQRRRPNDRCSRDKNRRWSDRSRNRTHSPMTPVIEDRKMQSENNSPARIPSLMQIPVMPPGEDSPESDNNPWRQGCSDSNDDQESNLEQGNYMRHNQMGPRQMGPGPLPPGPIPPGPMPPGLMGSGMMGPGPNMSSGPGMIVPSNMGPGPNIGSGMNIGPGMGPGPIMGPGPNMGPGQNMGPGPNMGPGLNMGPGPNMGPGSGPGIGGNHNMGPRPGMGPNMGPGSMMGPGGPNMPPMPPYMGGPPNFPMPPNFMGPNGPCGPGPLPPNMCGSRPNGPMPPFFGPPFNPMMGPNGPNSMMPPNSMNNGNLPFMGPRPPFGPNGPNMGPGNRPHMPFMPPNPMPPNSMSLHTIPEPKPLDTVTIPPPEPMKLQNIPPPMPLPLNHIPKPKDLDLGNIPAPPKLSQVLSSDSLPPSVQRAANEVACNGDHWENIVKAIHSQDQNLWFLHNTNSNEYKMFRELVHKLRAENNAQNKPEVKPEDKYEPEFCYDDDSNDDSQPSTKEDYNNYEEDKFNANWDSFKSMKRETSSQSDEDSDSKKERRKRKKSRWGNDPPPADIKPPGVITPLAPGVKLGSVEGEGLKLTKVNRSNPALLQYAMTNYGTTDLNAEDWKKCEDNFKLNLLYQDMLKKRDEVERLAMAGKHKYEYDSDEDTSEGTWEHRLRSREMNATELWATELTKQAAGKHHIGDFLPPEELKKFMEKYSSAKSGKEPDLSDYKEFKLKEDNVGFKMLQKLGWSEGKGLGVEGSGRVDPINKSNQSVPNLGLGAATDGVSPEDDEFDAYRKRMMLAYRFRPNPLNNPRRPYY